MVQAVDKNIMTSLVANSQEDFSPAKAIEAVGSSNEEDSGCGGGDDINKQKLEKEQQQQAVPRIEFEREKPSQVLLFEDSEQTTTQMLQSPIASSLNNAD